MRRVSTKPAAGLVESPGCCCSSDCKRRRPADRQERQPDVLCPAVLAAMTSWLTSLADVSDPDQMARADVAHASSASREQQVEATRPAASERRGSEQCLLAGGSGASPACSVLQSRRA
ncbi:hypothetical protein ON010_g13345 [Phytophthora cinnamomi]|nr:hypothetical protein ON010_g13345 [Phytophthora cinnamomi]